MAVHKQNWILLRECGEGLTRKGMAPFTRRQLIDCVHEKYPDRVEGSLNPMIQGMTVNLRDGAPGGIGKNVFYRVGRGLFELYDPKKHNSISDTAVPAKTEGEATEPSAHERIEETPPLAETKSTEDEIRDLLMQVLYGRVGREGSWEGSGKTASFDLKDEFKGYKCFAELPLSYTLPTGIRIDHTSDILIRNEEKGRYVSIEIKHRSAVTDQFKARSYDVIHFKKSYEDNLLGIMVYVKSTTGLSMKHAKSICYSFDHFFGIPSESRYTPTSWDGLISTVVEFLGL